MNIHINNYLAINHAKLVPLPEENENVDFQNLKRLRKAECHLKPSTDNINFDQNSKEW